MENLIGTSGTNTLIGTAGNNLLNGKAGDDYIDGGAGSDMIIAGAGNDIIVYDAIDKKIDGGTGYDTLLFLGTNQSLNLSTNLAVTNIEQLWLYGGGGHQLWLTAADIIRVSDNDRLLIKTDGAGSTIHPGAGWHFDSINSNGESVFINGAASMVVDKGVFVDGFSKNAVITSAAVASLMEDVNVNSAHQLERSVNITVTDINAGQGNLFSTPVYESSSFHYAGGVVTNTTTNEGNLSLTPNGAGSWTATYTINNSLSDIQGLNQGEYLVENFRVTAWDGSSKIISFTVQGADEGGNHDPSTAASSPLLVSVSGAPVFDEDSSYVKSSGQFDVSDADLQDVLSISWTGNSLGSFNAWVEHSVANSPTRTVKWTYTVDGNYMASLDPSSPQHDNFNLSITDNQGGDIDMAVSATIDPTLLGTPYNVKIIGTAGTDSHDPNENNVWMYGAGGNDQLTATFINSLLMGGDGDDHLETYGDLSGIIAGGAGNDTLQSMQEGDQIFGGSGNDIINAITHHQTISGGSGNDQIYSTGGDLIHGGAGDDEIVVGLGASPNVNPDQLNIDDHVVAHGDDGKDYFLVTNNGGSMMLYGDAGDDIFQLIDSMTGNMLSGGSGSDLYIFVGPTANSSLWITDFDFGDGAFVGDMLHYNAAAENYDGTSFDLVAVNTLSGNEPLPPGATMYYQLHATDLDTLESHVVLNLIASNGSSAYTTADILNNIQS